MVRKTQNAQKTRPIKFFKGRFAFLSNFDAGVPIQYEGILYPTVEHAFQAAKSLDTRVKNKIALTTKPHVAKSMGRRTKLRSDWETVKINIMKQLLDLKFKETALQPLLLETGEAYLQEGNTWNDQFWGVCKGSGENWLGKLLMQVRQEIQEAVHLKNEVDRQTSL
jgi:ribA/ribD-fused uncharacterized protein